MQGSQQRPNSDSGEKAEKLTDKVTGVVGPKDDARRRAYWGSAPPLIDPGFRERVSGLNPAVSNSRTANIDISMSGRKLREPFGTWKSKGIPFDTADRDERTKIRQWARMYYIGHYLMSSIINIYTRIPIQGMHLESPDKLMTDFYEQAFMDQLDYPNFWVDAGRELWTVGELTTVGSFNETLGVWDREEILNPDDIFMHQGPFDDEPRAYLGVPDNLRQIVETRQPAWQYDIIAEEFPEIVQAVQDGSAEGGLDDDGRPLGTLNISPSIIARTVQKVAPWDLYGTPHMLRVFDLLNQEEMLNAAQNAIADRLYSPMILAQLGGDNMLGQGSPWIPKNEDIAGFRDKMDAAMQADFRLIVHHYGVNIKSVFGRDQMPRLDNDFERLERKMLQAWGVGAELLSGGQGGSSYASSAINRDFLTQMLTTYQGQIAKHYRERALIVAEAQGHFEFRKRGKDRFPVYEEVVRIDEETGQEYIVKRPKLKIPELKFSTLNLKDEAQERTFLQNLRKDGAPISDQTMLVKAGIDFDSELQMSRSEKVAKAIDRAEYAKELHTALSKRDLLQYVQDKEIKELIADLEAPTFDAGASEGDSEGESPSSDETGSYADEEEGSLSPENRLKSRPEVSDEMRSSRYRSAGRIISGPSVVGKSELLTEESILELINNWGQETGGEK